MYNNFIINPGYTSNTTLGCLVVNHNLGFETPDSGIRAFADIWRTCFDTKCNLNIIYDDVLFEELELFQDAGWDFGYFQEGQIVFSFNFWHLLDDPEYEHLVIDIR